jgi:hypothetical protein
VVAGRLGQKPLVINNEPKTVVFVIGGDTAKSVEKSYATNLWQNCVWFCHVFDRLSEELTLVQAAASVKKGS